MARSRFLQDLASARTPLSWTELARRGVGRGQLRGPHWQRVGPGYYRAALSEISAGQRILDVGPRLCAGLALGSWASAYVLGVDWLDGMDGRNGDVLPVDVVNPRIRRRNPPGIDYHDVPLPEADVWVRHDLPITSAVRTAFDGARWAESVEEAVVFLDAMLKFGVLDPDSFLGYAGWHLSWAGVAQARRAAGLMHRAVRSPWESRLRICYRLDAGLPPPLVNVPVFDLDENLLGIADLFDPESALVVEYDGAQHREPDQHHNDNIREERFESANATVVRADKTDVGRDRSFLVHRIQDGRRRGLGRDRTRDRWTLTNPRWWRG